MYHKTFQSTDTVGRKEKVTPVCVNCFELKHVAILKSYTVLGLNVIEFFCSNQEFF